MTERHYLLRRCLRLEAKIAALQQKLADQGHIAKERRAYLATHPCGRRTTAADRDRIRALWAQGMSRAQIARETTWSEKTVAYYMPARERAVGE